MKILAATVLTIFMSATDFAQVAPGQAGNYTGTFKAHTVATDLSINDHSKMPVTCTISSDGTTTISSDDGLLITGNLVSSGRYGFFSMAEEFTTGTGIWKFSKRGNVKASLEYGVHPGGDIVYTVDSKLKLKREKTSLGR